MLLDIQMPVKDGLDVLEEATAAGICPKTIILSGHNTFSYAQKAIRYGVSDYLLKPCRSTEILQKLEKLALEVVLKQAQHHIKDKEIENTGNRLVEEALRYMRENFPDPITQPLVAEKLGVTPNYLSTLFTRNLSCGFVDCLNKIRIERACEYFADEQIKMYEVAFRVGFRDEKYFSSVFKKVMGISPSQYRRSHRNQ